ncbi:MAG: GntR family transcriptional regulator [Candidatus Bathyarchaeia archaeon]
MIYTKAITLSPLAQQVYSILKNQIVNNAYGAPLPINKLAKQLGVSPTPVREALRQLQAEGIVVYMARKGYKIMEITPELVHEIYESRLLLEPFAIHKIINTLSINKQISEKIEALYENAQKCYLQLNNNYVDLDLYFDIDLQLHELMCLNINNNFLCTALKTIGTFSQRVRRYVEDTIAKNSENKIILLKKITKEHINIISAIRSQNVKAAKRAVIQHLRNAERRTMDAIKLNEGE